MNFDINLLRTQVNEIFDEIVSLRREIHSHPELSEKETGTEALICGFLDKLQVPYRKDVAGHGVCAEIHGQNTHKAVAIRADIDALPISEKTGLPYASQNAGVMHACGHDMHTAILLGVAKILKANEAELPGTVKLLFQPSEETIGGARQMIEAGCLENPDVRNVIALHVAPDIDCGKLEFVKGYMNASSCEFYLTVKGKSCHGAHPEGGIDVLPPACAIVSGLQSIVTRTLPATTPAIITVGRFHSGTANNIVSGEANLGGIIRTLDLNLRDTIKQRVQRLAQDTAQAYGAACDVKFVDSYPSLKNDDGLFSLLSPVMEETFGRENIVYADVPSMGADDFAYFTQGYRGLYFNLGTHDPESSEYYPLHSDHFAPQEEAIRIGMLAELVGVYTILNSDF